MPFAGELAALGTSIAFSFTSVFFTLAGREVGSPIINRSRLLVATVLVILLHWLLMGQPLPLDASFERWWWLGLSAVIGLVLGDASLFQAFLMIGPRLSMLMMALAPVLGAILAWIFLDEVLTTKELVGIALTIGAVMWVVSEGLEIRQDRDVRQYVIGLLFGLGGAMGQAGGLVSSKIGLEGDFPALSGNLIRVLVAMVVIWTFTILRGQAWKGMQRLRAHPRAVRLLIFGTITGPVTGVWLSLIAVQNTPVGVASTLSSLMPIFLIPIGYVVFQERITRRAVSGTVLAFVGTVLLFL